MNSLSDRFASFDYFDEAVCVTDLETYDIVYANPTARRMMKAPYEPGQPGHKCYECFLGMKTPCVFCKSERLQTQKRIHWHKTNPISGKTLLLSDTLLDIDGRQYRLEVALEAAHLGVTDHDQPGDDIRKYYSYLTNCIRKLVRTEHFSEAVDAVLQTILYFYQADRAYLFEVDHASELWTNTFEICADGIRPEIDNLQNLPIESVSPYWVKCFQENMLVVIEKMSEVAMVPGREQEAKFLGAQGITSLFAIPVYGDRDQMLGFIGVDNPRTNLAQAEFLKSLTYFVGVEIDKHRMVKALRDQSFTDNLTGLQNRTAWNEFLKTHDVTHEQKIGVAFLDANGLKYLNDTFGHSFGDNYLKTLSELILKVYPKEQVFRISGDEFVIVDQGTTSDAFKARMKQLLGLLGNGSKDIAAAGYLWDNAEVSVSGMVGQAEQLMYAEKHRFYDESPDERSSRPRFADKVVEVFKKADYLVYLQPKADVATGKVYGAEALVRKRGEDGEIEYPAAFIGAMEEEHIISVVDFFVFEKVCETVRRWTDRGLTDFVISTNISRRTLAEIGFTDRISSILVKYGITGRNIVIEITEAARIVHMEKLREITQQLQAMGFRIAVDDVGTEYSAVDMLELDTLSMVKLDRALTKRIELGGRSEEIVRTLIGLCHRFGLECVAEGVEKPEQVERLKAAGCDRMQGYLIDRPMAVADFEKKYLPAEKPAV